MPARRVRTPGRVRVLAKRSTTGSLSGCIRRVTRRKFGTLHGVRTNPIGGDKDWLHLAYDDSPDGQQRHIAAKLKRENAHCPASRMRA